MDGNIEMKVYYSTHPDFDDHMSIETVRYDHEDGQDLAEACAKDYDDNSNWESSSEIDFYLWTDGEDESEPVFLGMYRVYREWEPTFLAVRKE